MSTPTTGERGRARAREIADAVLYEGYVLFPYHAAATKNRYRWQFGVLVPRDQVELGVAEASGVTSQVLLRATGGVPIEVVLRFLHPRRRQVERLEAGGHVAVDQLEVAGQLHTTWEEGVEHEHVVGPHRVDELVAARARAHIHLEASEDVEPLHGIDGSLVGRMTRSTEPVDLRVALHADQLEAGVLRLTTRVDNVSPWSDPTAERAETVRHGVAGLHLAIIAAGGELASAIDPPVWAAPWSTDCTNVGTYPVLAGPEGRTDVILSSPIILHDHPEIAEESPGDAYDATEIHELLTLCVQGLTDEEKRAARATEPRAAAVIDEADHLPPEMLERLHGAIRGLEPVRRPADEDDPTGRARDEGPAADLRGVRLNEPAASHPLEEELAEFLGAGEQPLERASLDDTEVAVGDRVRLRPNRRADAQDVFVSERVARVGRIVQLLDGEVQVGVILEDDPAADLHEWYGRFLYFHLDEITLADTGQESP